MYVGSAANNWLGLVTGLFSLNLCHLIESLIDAGGAQKNSVFFNRFPLLKQQKMIGHQRFFL